MGFKANLPSPFTRFYGISDSLQGVQLLDEFIKSEKMFNADGLPAISLFSGAGLSDLGYEQAGFRFIVQAELDEARSTLCQLNFPESHMVQGDLVKTYRTVIRKYNESNSGRLQLLSVTPPCQGMSSSNPGRGKISRSEDRDKRNRLILNSIPVIQALNPRIVVVENVQQILSESLVVNGVERTVIEYFREAIQENYFLFTGTIQLADYGIPQTRKRAILVAIHCSELALEPLLENKLLPWPRATRKDITNTENDFLPWITLEEWFNHQNYPALDSQSSAKAKYEEDFLHCVPNYEKEPDRYLWIKGIPPGSGQNAYKNAECPSCNFREVPENTMYCPKCNSPMINRPYVKNHDGSYRLIKGFHSSYRRMSPDKPAPTVMTSSSHLGSDYKIHPWENRVLSVRECADLQTIPRFYNWHWAFESKHTYVARQVIGEALPAWFTYLHGSILRRLLNNEINFDELETQKSKSKGRKRQKSEIL